VSSPELSSSSKPRVPYRKPRADIYTVLLALALVAVLIGLTFLALEMDMYMWEFKGGPTASLQRPMAVAMADLSQPVLGRLSEIHGSLPPIL